MNNLPIHEHLEEISALLKQHQVIVVAGETGSGKSTQLPQLCHCLFPGLIGHTQPRRIAAKTIATRIAEEMKVSLGTLVGYQMRFNEAISQQTAIKVMTDGILLAETRDDPLLKRYQVLIIDEVHERSLNIDFILGYLKQILPKRPELKVILTSATLDHERLASHFQAPIVLVEGRSYPIETHYQPLTHKTKDTGEALYNGVITALMNFTRHQDGDILVFLPTERDIRDMRKRLAERFQRQEVLPLYARLPMPSQQKVFHPGNQSRIILATNVAETSITVPNVRYVIDSGMARVSRFNAKLKIQRLPIEAISQANAKQRAGRAGRTAPGVVVRLYEETDLLNRPEFLEPELLRTNLAAVILLMLKLKLGDVKAFPFVDPPPRSLIHEGYQELLELQAIELRSHHHSSTGQHNPSTGQCHSSTGHSRAPFCHSRVGGNPPIEAQKLAPHLHEDDKKYILTTIGKQMSDMPLDPRLARMLVAAKQYRVLPEVLAIVSNLTIQDPREYPEDQLGKAMAAHQRDVHPESEFLTILNLWSRVHEATADLSHNRFKRYCVDNFLSYTRFREWQALHAELHRNLCHSHEKGNLNGQMWGLDSRLRGNDKMEHGNGKMEHENGKMEHGSDKMGRRNDKAPTKSDQQRSAIQYQAIHQALLTGSLHFVGFYDQEKQRYRGAHNKTFQVFPGSSLAKKKFKWLMAESLMETRNVYARIVARIEANWLEPISKHLVRYHYAEPFYDSKMDEVMARESVLLYGLPIVTGRKTLFAKKAPALAREIFIREAIIPQYTETARQQLENWEAKLRRLGICFNDDEAFEFYDATLPHDAISFKSLETMVPEFDIQKRLAGFKTLESKYPDDLDVQGHTLPLVYKFEPGEKDDGVTLNITLNQLAHMPNAIQHPNADLQLQFLITNEDGQGLARSFSIKALKNHFHDELNELINTDSSDFDNTCYRRWDFPDLPDATAGGIPALTPEAEGVMIRLYHNPTEADRVHVQGILKLLSYYFAKDLKTLKSNPEVINALGTLTFIQNRACLTTDFLNFALRDFFAAHDCSLANVRTSNNFHKLLELQGQFYSHQQHLQKWLQSLSEPLLNLRLQLKNLSSKQGLKDSVTDLQDQFLSLCQPHFLLEVPLEYLQRYPVYFKGMQIRIQRLQHNPTRELALLTEFSETVENLPATTAEQYWLIEEYRLSLFAQELKTLIPISSKKIHALFAKT